MRNSTFRPHTPPSAFFLSQYSARPACASLLAGANGPVWSVRTPSLIVESVTPGPVASWPLLAASVLDLVEQPAASSSAAASRPVSAPMAGRRRGGCDACGGDDDVVGGTRVSFGAGGIPGVMHLRAGRAGRGRRDACAGRWRWRRAVRPAG